LRAPHFTVKRLKTNNEFAMNKQFLAILSAGVWMNINEFIRNELVVKHLWVEGFNEIGLSFPSSPINGAVWGLWAFIFIAILSWLCTKFSVLISSLIAWFTGFVLLWIAIWNMGVLPKNIIYWAIPWSFFEVYVAALICSKIMNIKSA
jgi:hypothetical protein